MNNQTERKQYRRRPLPFSTEEYALTEAWLEDMALNGWALREIGVLGICKFERTQPTQARYRVDVLPVAKYKEKAARRTMLQEAGWRCLTVRNNCEYIYVAENTDQTELPPLPPELEPTWNSERKKRNAWIVGLCLFAGLIAMTLWSWRDYWRISPWLEDWMGGPWLSAVWCLAALVVLVYQLHISRRNRREGALEKGPSRADYTAKRARQGMRLQMIYPTVLACLMVFTVVAFVSGEADRSQPLPDDNSLPFPLLAQVNPTEGESLKQLIQLEEKYHNFDGGADHFMVKRTNLICPTILHTYQWGPTIREALGNGRMMSRPLYTMNNSYYAFWSEGLARTYFEERRSDLGKEMALQSAPSSMQATFGQTSDRGVSYGPQGDDAYLAEAEDAVTQTLILQYKKLVMVVSYSGQSDLRELLPLYESYLVT